MYRKKQAGLVTVEAVIALPALILVTFVTIEMGALFFTYNSMINAARNTARTLAVGEIDESEAQSDAQAELSYFASLTFTVNAVKGAGSAGNDVRVTITTPMADAAIINLFSMIQDDQTLTAIATFRDETT